jgi:hypothetical protein
MLLPQEPRIGMVGRGVGRSDPTREAEVTMSLAVAQAANWGYGAGTEPSQPHDRPAALRFPND